MAVFNPSGVSLTPAYENIQNILQQRAQLELKRPSPYDIGTNALNTVATVEEAKRKRSQDLEDMATKHRNEIELKKLDSDAEMRKAVFQEEFRRQLEKEKDARAAVEASKQRAHERRGEMFFTPDKVAELENELGVDQGTLGDLNGRSLTQDQVDKTLQGAFKKVVAHIQAEPKKDTPIAKFSGKGDQPVTFGDTEQYATRDQRLKSALVGATSKDALDDISKSTFINGGAGAGKVSPTDIKGMILTKMMTDGYDTLSNEQKMIIDSEINKDPAMNQAIRVYGTSGGGFGKSPAEVYADVNSLASQFRSDAVARAQGDQVVASMSPKQKATYNQNVDDAVSAINGKTDSYENVMNALQAANPTYFQALKKDIDSRLKKKAA